MNKLYGTASVNGTQETAENINTNTWPIRMHNSGCGRCETKTTATNYLEYQRKIHLFSSEQIDFF